MVAKRIEVAAESVGAWEQGWDAPSLSHLIRWARIFELQLAVCDEHGDRSLPEIILRDGEPWEYGEIRRLAASLYDVRRVRQLTQSALGQRLGFASPTILRWEQARRRPKVVTLVRWARGLDCVVQLRAADQP